MSKCIKLFFLLLPVFLNFSCKDNHENKATIANLKAAIKGEIRDYKKYSAYSAKADEEGYTDLGRLFQVISGIEHQHARFYMNTLNNYGINIDSFDDIDIEKYSIGTSFDNLMNSINSEKLDVNEIYDRYAKIARDEKMFDAVEAINQISSMENKNVQMLQDFSMTFKPSMKKKNATIGTTFRVDF